MSFLHLGLLAGAALVAVPIVLHLVMRQQPKHLEFPALRFLVQRQEANRRRLKLRHLLLLALRCALVALLAFTLARPRIQAGLPLGDQAAPVAAVLVFDTSPRMEFQHQNASRLQAAQDAALWLLPQFPQESDVAVIDSASPTSGYSIDASSARARIKRLKTSAAVQPLEKLFEEGLRLAGESQKVRKELYVFTDLTRSAWGANPQEEGESRWAEYGNVSVYLIDVGVSQPRNTAIVAARPTNDVVSKNVPLRIRAEVTQIGPAEDKTVELYLIDAAGKPTKRSEQLVRFDNQRRGVVHFSLGSLEPGIQQGYVKLLGQDALAVDDARYFSVEVTPAWRVLLVAPRPAEESAFFLREALAPYDLRSKNEVAFQCDLVSLDELAARKLDGYSCVCLLDPGPLPSAQWRSLSTYVAKGGGLAIFLGRNARPVDAFNTPEAAEVLPAKLLRQWRAGQRDIYLAPETLQHPLLNKFRVLETSVPWNAFPVFRHWELGPLVAGASVVIPYSNNLPALVERVVGRGRVLTFTTPISDPASSSDLWNTLPFGDEPWPFFMLANEMMYYLTGGSEVRLNYFPRDTAVLPLPRGEQPSRFVLTTPSGDSLRVSADQKQHALLVGATDVPGNYQARAGGGGQSLQLGFSVNVPPEMSQLDRVDENQLKKSLAPLRVQLAHNREEIDRTVSKGRAGQELYPYLIVLVVLVLAGEHLLANRFYRANPPPAQQETVAREIASFRDDRTRRDQEVARVGS